MVCVICWRKKKSYFAYLETKSENKEKPSFVGITLLWKSKTVNVIRKCQFLLERNKIKK